MVIVLSIDKSTTWNIDLSQKGHIKDDGRSAVDQEVNGRIAFIG